MLRVGAKRQYPEPALRASQTFFLVPRSYRAAPTCVRHLAQRPTDEESPRSRYRRLHLPSARRLLPLISQGREERPKSNEQEAKMVWYSIYDVPEGTVGRVWATKRVVTSAAGLGHHRYRPLSDAVPVEDITASWWEWLYTAPGDVFYGFHAV